MKLSPFGSLVPRGIFSITQVNFKIKQVFSKIEQVNRKIMQVNPQNTPTKVKNYSGPSSIVPLHLIAHLESFPVPLVSVIPSLVLLQPRRKP